MAKLKITKTNSVSGTTVDKHVSPTIINGYNVGGTGGLTSQTGSQIQPQVFATGGSSTTGSILFQKGAHKFRVTDGTHTDTCTLVNSPNLVAKQMNILVNLNTTTADLSAGTTTAYVTWSSVTGPVATPRVGDYVIGFSGGAAVAQVTAINTSTNVTIALSANTAGETGVSITTSTYAKKVSNKFVNDFNGAKFRYHLAAPDATFVQVQSA
jgi:hypothetical protein